MPVTGVEDVGIGIAAARKVVVPAASGQRILIKIAPEAVVAGAASGDNS